MVKTGWIWNRSRHKSGSGMAQGTNASGWAHGMSSTQSMNPDRHNVKRNFKSGDVYYYKVETEKDTQLNPFVLLTTS
jgi:hypothetical protein